MSPPTVRRRRSFERSFDAAPMRYCLLIHDTRLSWKTSPGARGFLRSSDRDCRPVFLPRFRRGPLPFAEIPKRPFFSSCTCLRVRSRGFRFSTPPGFAASPHPGGSPGSLYRPGRDDSSLTSRERWLQFRSFVNSRHR